MDRATDYPGMGRGRWAAIMLALMTCGAELGCARMNPFLRDEPPMLGTITPPTATSSKWNGPAQHQGLGRGQGAGGPVCPSNDLYAQSFNRTQPRPAAPGQPTAEQPAPGETPPPQTASASGERGPHDGPRRRRRMPSNPLGVVLKPPVSLRRDPTAQPQPLDPAHASHSEPAAPQDLRLRTTPPQNLQGNAGDGRSDRRRRPRAARCTPLVPGGTESPGAGRRQLASARGCSPEHQAQPSGRLAAVERRARIRGARCSSRRKRRTGCCW